MMKKALNKGQKIKKKILEKGRKKEEKIAAPSPLLTSLPPALKNTVRVSVSVQLSCSAGRHVSAFLVLRIRYQICNNSSQGLFGEIALTENLDVKKFQVLHWPVSVGFCVREKKDQPSSLPFCYIFWID